MLARFQAVMKRHNHLNGLTWYYALCMDVTLDTSLMIVSFEECKQFYLQNIEHFSRLKEKQAVVQFYANILLWAARKSNWEVSHIFFEHVHETFQFSSNDTCTNVFILIRILEAMILSLINMIDSRNVKLIKARETELRQHMAIIERALPIEKCHTGRYLLLKTYFQQVIDFKHTDIFFLKPIMSIALKYSNFMAYDMLKHNYEVRNLS